MPDKKRKLIRRTLRFLIGFLLLLLAGMAYFMINAIDRPPVVQDLTSLNQKRIVYGNNTYVYGRNWLRKSESGLWEAYIEGSPFERGVAFGRLTRELLYFQETSFVEQIRELVPSDAYLKVLKYFIAFFNRNLDKNIPAEYKEEIYGTSFSCSPEYDFIGSGYQRQLNYHAAHDIGHALQDLSLVACTSFSVWDGSSADSSLLIGRNFDFYMGKKFAENKIICFVNPAQGYKFMTVTWADMIGVVSGMNEKGLTVTLNAAKSSIPRQAATPVTLLAREILQYASNIREAYAISKKHRLFVSESLLIGSAQDGKSAVIEKSPATDDIVYPEGERIICSNHYQGKVFADDKINLENIRNSDSYARYQRVNELLQRKQSLDVEGVVEILRDRRGLGDSDVGLGNQLSINQLIAHHAVVFKPESLQAWVSAGPWQEGKFVAYDLKRIFSIPMDQITSYNEISTESLTLEADTFLNSADYLNFLKYENLTSTLRKARKNREQLPGDFAGEYIRSNPSLYLTYAHLGDYFEALNSYKEARQYYTLALSKKLPGLNEENNLKEKIERLQNKR